MAGRFVRSSKYRHVFGRPTRKEQCYDNIRVSRNAWDTNLVKANPEYLAVNWDSSGGGAFAVIPLDERGKLPEHIPLCRGHTAVVLDTDWNPFNDSIIASGSDDAKIFIWRVPEGFTLRPEEGEEIKDIAPVAKLTGHSRKIGHVLFNPAAENILATSSGDFTVKIWDAEASSAIHTLKHAEVIQSLSWSANGSMLVTTSRDKKLRIWDVRQERPAHEGPGHAGAKNSRAVWMGEHDRIATTGFSKMSDRQLGLWDVRNANAPMDGFSLLDSISGICIPFWDDGTQCLYLAGKGDGNIRYYEYENDSFEYLSEYKSADPQRGIAFLPKRGVNIHENEVMRAFKTVNDSYIEPISFIVPRRAEVFQGDIYPPTVGLKPGISGKQWMDGKEALPPKIDLESVYNGEAPADVPSNHKTAVVVSEAPPPAVETKEAPEPAKAPEPVQEEPTPTPASVRAPTSVKDQGAAVSSMVSKFADDEPEDDGDETSSFEEVAEPVERSTKQTVAAAFEPPKVEPSAAKTLPSTTNSPQKTAPAPAPVPAPVSSLDKGEVQSSLQEITQLLQHQQTMMSSQNDMIAKLSTEIENLKARLGE